MTNKNETEKENKPFYHGHRQRLRTRFMENGIDSLQEHEILEFILFHSIPRVDTKPLAHKLIDSFGSLKNVLGASNESLKQEGLSDISVALIKVIYDTSRWIFRNETVGKKCSDLNEAGVLMVRELDECATETFAVLLLDSKDCILDFKKICEGNFRSTNLNMRTLVQNCLDKKASKVIVAHNHPSGGIKPSADDHVTTAAIDNYLTGIGVKLVEHFIVADGTYFGIMRNSEEARRSAEKQFRRNFTFDEN